MNETSSQPFCYSINLYQGVIMKSRAVAIIYSVCMWIVFCLSWQCVGIEDEGGGAFESGDAYFGDYEPPLSLDPRIEDTEENADLDIMDCAGDKIHSDVLSQKSPHQLQPESMKALSYAREGKHQARDVLELYSIFSSSSSLQFLASYPHCRQRE